MQVKLLTGVTTHVEYKGMKDETLSHVELFKDIFRTAIVESFDGVIPAQIQNKAKHMIMEMVTAEKRWTKYVSKGLMGFSDRAIDVLVEQQANSVCKNLGLPTIYPKDTENPLKKLLVNNLKGGVMESRSNFFENNVAEYSKGALEIDF